MTCADHPRRYCTPNGAVIVARAADGTETVITGGVQALYDLVLSSMDWGSGFWTVDDAAPVSVVGHACGFAQIEEVDAYIAARTHEAETAAWRQAMGSVEAFVDEGRPHVWRACPGHVLSSTGCCMWPGCKEGRES